MSRRQDGQALVGSLVVTTLAFLMAGAVAVGASALLSQVSNPQNASSHDLAAQDALAAAVAAVAGQGSAGGSAPCAPPRSFTRTLPSGYVSQALCARADGVPPGPVTLVYLTAWSGACAVVPVPTFSQTRALIWFSANGNTSAWVDGDQSGCAPDPPLACIDAVTGSVTQVLLDCNFAAIQEGGNNRNARQNGSGGGGGNQGQEYLHVVNAAHSPAVVRLTQYVSSGGSIYVLAASTGLTGGPAYEEADLWVSPDGATTALRFEGTL